MPLADWQFAYNGVTFGAETDYELKSVEGLGPLDIRTEESERAGEHGATVFAQFYPHRVITFEGDTLDAPITTTMVTIQTAFAARRTPLPLTFKVPDIEELRILAYPKRFATKHDRVRAIGIGDFIGQVVSEDPRIYSNTLQTAAIASGASAVCANAGNFRSPPVATIPAGAVNPRITNATTGEFIELSGTLASALTLDFWERTIKTSGGSSEYGKKNPASVWWDVDPGNNTIEYTGGGSLTFTWRSAWTGV